MVGSPQRGVYTDFQDLSNQVDVHEHLVWGRKCLFKSILNTLNLKSLGDIQVKPKSGRLVKLKSRGYSNTFTLIVHIVITFFTYCLKRS